MSLFQTERGGAPMMNAYQFQTHAALPDISGFMHLAGAAARGRGTGSRGTGSGDGQKGMFGAVQKLEWEKAAIAAEEEAIYQEAYDDFERHGNNDMPGWLSTQGRKYSERFLRLNQRKLNIPAYEANLENDLGTYKELAKDTDYNSLTSLLVGPDGISPYGVRKDGTVGYGGFNEMSVFYNNAKALAHINANAEMVGNLFPTKYDANSGRDQLQKHLMENVPNLITFGEDLSTFSGNIQAISGFLRSGVESLTQEEYASLLHQTINRAEKWAIKEAGPDGKVVDYDYMLPVMDWSVNYNGDRRGNTGQIVQSQAVGEDGKPQYIDVRESPGEAMVEMGRQYAVNLAAGKERITITQRQRVGGTRQQKNDYERGWFTEMNLGRMMGEDVLFGFQRENVDVLKHLEDIGVKFDNPAQRQNFSNALALWENTPFDHPQYKTNRERINSPDPSISGPASWELVEYLEAKGKSIGVGLGTDDKSKISNFFAEAQVERRGFRKTNKTALKPEEILLNVVMGQSVSRHQTPQEYIEGYQKFNNGWLPNDQMIRIAGSTITSAGQIGGQNRNLPIEVGPYTYAQSWFLDDYKNPHHVPSYLAYTYVTEDMLKNISFQLQDGERTKTENLHKHRRDLTDVPVGSIGAFTDARLNDQLRQRVSAFVGYDITAQSNKDKKLYRIPIIVPVRNWMEHDNFVFTDKRRNQVTFGMYQEDGQITELEAMYAAQQMENAIIQQDRANVQPANQ